MTDPHDNAAEQPTEERPAVSKPSQDRPAAQPALISPGDVAWLLGLGLTIFGVVGFLVIGIPVDNPAPSIILYTVCVSLGPALIGWGERR
jgi:hypothetical protein